MKLSCSSLFVVFIGSKPSFPYNQIEFARKNFSSLALFQLGRLFTLLANFYVLSHVYSIFANIRHLFRSHFVQMASNVALSFVCCLSTKFVKFCTKFVKYQQTISAPSRYHRNFCCYLLCWNSFYLFLIVRWMACSLFPPFINLKMIQSFYPLKSNTYFNYSYCTWLTLHRILAPQQQWLQVALQKNKKADFSSTTFTFICLAGWLNCSINNCI